MMEELLSRDGISYIVSRVLSNARDAIAESKEEDSDFLKGKRLAYYEILDTIKNELIVREADLKEFELDIILEELL